MNCGRILRGLEMHFLDAFLETGETRNPISSIRSTAHQDSKLPHQRHEVGRRFMMNIVYGERHDFL